MRRRSATVTIGLTAIVAAGLTGCGAVEATSTTSAAVTTVSTMPDTPPDTTTDTAPEAGDTAPATVDAPVDAVTTDVASEEPTDEPTEESTDPSGDVTDASTDLTDGSGGGTDESSDGSGDAAQYTAVCVDQSGEQRVDDAQCAGVDPQQQHVAGHHHGLGTALVAWYFLRAGSSYPAVGSRVVGGSYTPPAASYRVGGLPVSKGTVRAATRSSVSKGGFGGSHRSGSIGG